VEWSGLPLPHLRRGKFRLTLFSGNLREMGIECKLFFTVSADRAKTRNPVSRLWQAFRRQIVDDVPEGDALCEFDCRKEQCRLSEWEQCDRRIRKGSGELFPDSRPR